MLTSCPVCEDFTGVYTAHHLDFNQSAIYRCATCAHWFTAPEPSTTAVEAYYALVYAPRRNSRMNETYYASMQRRATAQLAFICQALYSQEPRCGAWQNWKALDLGCGIGALVNELTQNGVDAVRLDSDTFAIEHGQKCWQVNLVVGDANNLAPYTAMVDLLCLSHFVEHLPHLRSTLAQILKTVRSQGYVFIEVPRGITLAD